MSIGDKIKHAAEEAVGKVKEATGNVTDNESLKAEGQADQASANTKQAGDKVGDTVTHHPQHERPGTRPTCGPFIR